MTKLFETKREHCPQCGSELAIRNGAHGAFKGCVSYPQCNYIQPLKQVVGHLIKIIEDKTCPQCGKYLALRQGRFGMYFACENYPYLCQYVDHPVKENIEPILCPQCQKGVLTLRHSRFGKAFYGCDHFPTCKFILNTEPISGVCSVCRYPLLTKKKSAQDETILCANKHCGTVQLT